ncbi:MAG: DUF3147 family protein [bacterium]
MDWTFWYKLFLSFLVGGCWVTLTTTMAEKFGSKIGGLLGGMPSTIVVSLLFIGLTQNAEVASQATTIVPLAHGFNTFFILVFVLSIPKGLKLAVPVSLLTWFISAILLILLNISRYWISLGGWLVFLGFAYILMEKIMRIDSHGTVAIVYSTGQILFRAIFSGSAIAFAVLMGKLGGPLFGGIFATFPAMFLTTLIITHRSGGAEFSRATAKSLLISGLINVILYTIFVRYLFLTIGLFWGTGVALLISAGTGYLTYLFMKAKIS